MAVTDTNTAVLECAQTVDKDDVVTESEKVELKRELGLIGATSMVIGSIIGSGIFISPKGVLEATGSIGLCFIVWVLAGVLSLGNSLCYAELGTSLQKSGGTYTYIQMGIGNYVAFTYAVTVVLIASAGGTIISLVTFSKYLMSLGSTCGTPAYIEKFTVAFIIVSLTIINSYSTRLTAKLTILTTVGKLAALIAIIIGGFIALSENKTGELGTGFSGTSNEPSSLALALYSASWVNSGGESVAAIVEETKNPSKTIPRSMVIGSLIVIVVYLLTNVSYLAVMTKAELLNAEAVAVLFGERALGSLFLIIPVGVLVSTLGSTNNHIFSSTRAVYVAAKDGNLPEVLSYIQIQQLTPLSALVVTGIISLLLLTQADAQMFINYIEFLNSFYYVCTYIAFLRFRFQLFKDIHRPIKLPIIVPILMLLMNLYMFIAPLAINPSLDYVYVALSVFGGSAILYIVFIYFRLSPPYFDTLVSWYQLTTQVCPPTK